MKRLPLRTGGHYLFNRRGVQRTSPGFLVSAPREITQPPPWGLMTDGIVGWHFFDAESGLVPEELGPSSLPAGGTGRIVALAATPFAQADGWASRAVVAIAKEWAQKELRIFLMDLGLDAPTLHRALGLLNREGVSDAFLYGASVQRIAQPALDDLIFFAPAGTATTDPEQILGHPRWNDLAGGFSEADATLLLFLPTDIPGADKILSRATDVLFLAGQGESAEAYLGPAAIKVVAMAGPAGSPPGESSQVLDGSMMDESEPEEVLPGNAFDFSADDLLSDEGSPEDRVHLTEKPLSLAEGFVREFGGKEAEPGESPSESSLLGDMETGPILDEGFVHETADGLAGGVPWGDPGSGGTAEETPGQQTEFEDQGIPALDVPDFGAEFIELPPLEPEPPEGSWADKEMVSGSAFRSDDPEMSASAGEAPDAPDSRASAGSGAEAGGGRRFPHPPDRPKPISKLRPPPKKKHPVRLLAGVGVLAVVLIAAGGTAAGLFNVPGFTWLQGLFGNIPYPELTMEGAQPTEAVLRFSLELDLYQEEELGVAIEMRNALRQRLPELLFTLVPKGVGDVASYALYAGPGADMVEVENLRVPISEVITREDPESWPIRATPRAFLLGESETRAEAQEYLVSVEAEGGLGYVLHVTYPDGSDGYQILSGAYQGVEDARWWQLALRKAGFRDVPLIERRGRPPE